jgi:transposase InsO family protein
MPWQEQSTMTLRGEFVQFAQREGANLSALCRQFGISRPTGYKWLARAQASGPAGLVDQTRRPHTSPRQTPPAHEALVLDLRAEYPVWGGRKLARVLARDHGISLSPSTITSILHRHGLLAPDPERPRAWQSFERDAPNELWQLDFMGDLPYARGRVHPLTLLDDHARFALCLRACADQQRPTVQTTLTTVFQRYGLPQAILTDNGPPWGTSGAGGWTRLDLWLIRLGIHLIHGRAYHPQTQGKVERLHRTIQAEVGDTSRFPDLASCQGAFDQWRQRYNLLRPHQALDLDVPASRYQPSPRPFPPVLQPIAYGPDDALRKVNTQGVISFQNRRHFVGRGLAGQPVAVRPTQEEEVFAVYYCHQRIAILAHDEVLEV